MNTKLNKRKLRMRYRKLLFSYTFDVFEPIDQLANLTNEH